ncbi:MAG TPA: hypothetical protein VD994_19765, partial [Prosthecobacter sp.]|nr:hypothetical protein [Prosthecobacter sp.]
GTVGEAAAFIDRSTTFGAWRNFQNVEGSAGIGASANLRAPIPGFGTVLRPRYGQDPYIGFKFGPFYVDNVYAGAGVMYSDYQGFPPGVRPGQQADADHWGAVVWASARLTTYITDRFAFSLQPFVYWLPLEGEVGWAVGNAYFGLNPSMSPRTVAQVSFRIPLEAWDLTFYDQFDALFLQQSFLSENVIFDARMSDLSPVDTVGRYRFGGLGSPYIDARGQASFSANDRLFDNDRFFFRNFAGALLAGRLSEDVSMGVTLNRMDLWDSDFDHLTSWNTASVAVVRDGGRAFKPYAMYTASTRDDFDIIYQWINVGASFVLAPQVDGYAQVGYLWSTGGEGLRDSDSWLGEVGLRQRLGIYTEHGLRGGRRVTDPEFGARSLADFVTYYFSQSLGPNTTLSFLAQYSDVDYLGDRFLGDYKAYGAALVARHQISRRSSLTAYASFERVEADDARRGWDLWTYRLTYLRSFGETVTGQLLYQYQHSASSVTIRDDFTEHLLYMGIIKRF